MAQDRKTSFQIRKTTTLKRVFSISESEALRDMTRNNRVAGSPGVAWHRGHQAGVWDAILTLKQISPRMADKVRRAFGMNEEGNYIL